MSARRVLIVGGTGNISGALVDAFLAAGHHVTVLNRGQRQRSLPADVRVLLADRRDRDAFETQVQAEAFDAALDMICYSAEDAESDLRAFRDVEHVIHTSTVATFGGPLPRLMADERTPVRPVSAYGHGKAEADRVFLRAREEHDFPVTIVKPASTWGPGMPVIRQLGFDRAWIHRLRTGRPLLIAGDGQTLWSLCHSEDVAQAYRGLLFAPWAVGETYIATAPHPVTWERYHLDVAEALGVVAHLVSAPADLLIRSWHAGTQLLAEQTRWHQCYDVTKLQSALPEWQPRLTLVDRIAENVAWMESAGLLDTGPSAEEDRIVAALGDVRTRLDGVGA
jgi:nucleoside-diphosphate-sugar epimerase